MNENISNQDKNQQKIIHSESVQPAIGCGQEFGHEKYHNIVFDLGAVLLHFNPYEILKDLFGMTKEQAQEIVKHVASPIWADMDKGLITPAQVADKLGSEFGKENMMKYLNAMPDRLKPIPQGVEILNQVRSKGYKTYILSNLAEFCYIKVKDFEFIKNFDGAIYSYQHGCAKPDARIYKTLFDTYSLKAEECLFIDDLEVNIHGSKAVGMDGIVCKDHDYVKEQLKLLKII